MKNITKFQEPADTLNWQHDNKKLSNFKKFNKTWLKERKDILKENAQDTKTENNYRLQQLRLSTVRQIPAYTKAESAYFPETHQFIINYNAAQHPIFYNNHVVHEKTHSQFGNNPQESPQINKLMQTAKINFDDANELYPILQEIRYQFKINPKHTFDLKDIEYFRNYVKDKESEDVHHFLNTYDNETIMKIFNDVAQNESSQLSFPQNDLFYSKQNYNTKVATAQLGTKLLTPHKDYLGIPYKQDGNYNYFSAHPENMPTNPEEHWTSRNPVTGQLLKSENHPTFNLLLNGEQEAGMQIYRGLDGNLYSYLKEQQVPLYLKYNNYEYAKW